jgi:D-alanyl-D-alanine dipeptidase
MDPEKAGVTDLPPQPPLPRCVSDERVRLVPTAECGEGLENVDGCLATLRAYARQEFAFRSLPKDMLVRRGVLDRLLAASDSLPRDFGLIIIDGWRSAEFQVELRSYYARSHNGPLKGYVADPSDSAVVPPHTTGGAVDLTLGYGGVPLALGTDFDQFTPAAHLWALDEADRPTLSGKLRRLLANSLISVGFSPYPWEWWHWSYGDQRWAAQYGMEAARYGAVLG